RFAWYTAVTAVLIGHMIAVYLAHLVAMREFAPRRATLQSQVPLTALMVVFTFISLSILAEPIVERREPARPSAIPITVIPHPTRRVAARTWHRSLASGRSGQIREGEIDLPRARLGLP